ncbi:hypothetical protein WMY93_030315 [Mugilogobius chulae]|uniref:Uncharacterized protein n=1 Tax=Mugilogobius chulae TaxID=88201 RepID=A0AAW0MJY2_9GOBI
MRIQEYANRDKIKEVEELKRHRATLEQQIDVKQQEVIQSKVRLACFKDIDREASELEAGNEKLQKKYDRLEKERQQLSDNQQRRSSVRFSDDRHEERKRGTVREGFTLEHQIEKKKMLEARLKSLKCRKKSLEKERKSLEKQASDLEKKRRSEDQLLEKRGMLEEEILNERGANEEVQRHQELQEFSDQNREQEVGEMRELNEEQRATSGDRGESEEEEEGGEMKELRGAEERHQETEGESEEE